MGNRRKLIDSFLKMDAITWLTLAVAIITLATPASTSEPRVVCYYTNWSVYRPGTAKFNPQNINPYLCTHLIYAFGGFTKDNTLKPFDKYQDIEKGGYAKFTGLKTYNKNLKTMLAIGGWNEGSSRFSPMVGSKERRKEFVRNAIKFLRQNRFDGLDLDWEYPAFRDGGKPKDRENYARLVRELREEFDREAEKTGRPRLLLTMAVPAGIEYIQKGFDVKTLNRYLDWMNLLTYDYHSAFEPAVNHHAPLYPLEEPNEYSVDNELNIDYTIKFYLENGADRDKLVLGIPTYGRSYTLFNADAVEIGSPADGPGEQGDATREKGYLAYYEICEALKPKVKKRSTSDEESDEVSEEDEEEEEEDAPWTVMYPNPNAMGPVAFRGNQWVGYDDVDIVKKKAEYVAENGLGGIMFWSIDNDDFRGTCHSKPYPLIEAAKEAYIVKLGSTDNAIVTDKPRSTTSRSSSRRRNRPRSSSTTTTTAKPSSVAKSSSKRKSGSSVTSTTPAWNNITPEPPTTPDPGSDFKCKDEGFFPHPRDCKKYFWCLDSGPSNLGIVAHQFTCPSGLFFNKAADSCDFARNVLCKKPSETTKAPTTKAPTTKAPTTEAPTTTKRPVRLSTKSSALFRTTTRTTTSTTAEPEVEEEYDDDLSDSADVEAEDPRVIKELIDLIKKVGGVEQLEKHLHLAETSMSTGDALTTTPSSFNKRLYQKVLERTRANKINGNSLLDTALNSRGGPQNAGLEPSSNKDKLLRKDRPQYTTINRSRTLTTSTTEEPLQDEDIEDEVEDAPQKLPRARAAESENKIGTTAKPLQYVNIRRARPTQTTSDTADDTASRNALFERPESYVTVSETPNSLDIASARRENIPEYVTIRRQRPTTEEATTAQYQNTEPEVETQETALEKEISSSSSQPQYTSIVRSRSTTLPPPEELSNPEPTTVLAVQISSLLNSPSSSEESSQTTVAEVTEVDSNPPLTTTSTTTTTTTTTPAPSSITTRRTLLRRRGSTTTSTPTSTTQATKRSNFLRRTKATSPPEAVDTEPATDTIDTSTPTSKFTRRGGNKFKTRKDSIQKDLAKKDPGNEIENKRPPSLNSGATRSERPTRNFVRRRLGGANATISTTPLPTTVVARRPFRVASRRRPVTATITTTTTSTTTQPTTAVLISEESLQDIGDTDSIEEPTLQGRIASNKTTKVQRRPLVLKNEEVDQNPSATNEDERKRQSKKYSASFKQNQLDEVLRQKAKSQEDVTDVTTEAGTTTADDYSAETALAIAAHQLLAAPVPSISNYDEDDKPTKKSSHTRKTTQEYRYTSPEFTEDYTDAKTLYDEYTSTPIYKTTIPKEYVTSTGSVYNGLPSSAFISYNPGTSTTVTAPKSSFYPSTTFTNRVSRPSGFTTPNVVITTSGVPSLGPSTASSAYSRSQSADQSSSTSGFLRSQSVDPSSSNFGFSRSQSVDPSLSTFVFSRSQSVDPSSSTSGFLRSQSGDPSSLTPVFTRLQSVVPTSSTSGFSRLQNTDPTSSFSGFSRSQSVDPSSSTSEFLSSQSVDPSSSTSGFLRSQNVDQSSSTSGFSRSQSVDPSSSTSGFSQSQSLGPSTVRYQGTSNKLIPVPVEDYTYSTGGYSTLGQEPSYFTREYLLESPVTKTYDDEYQYLSPITTPLTPQTTRKIPKKTVYRKISTTLRPTEPSYVPPATTTKPRRGPPRKPFEKIPVQKAAPNRTYKPIENYDYYDDSHEKMAEKYEEGTKVIIHAKGNIECLDIGNFPSPSSCKKFISCARLENGSLLGWEYICPKGLSFDPVGGICNWSAGLGCDEKDI